jgi:hypothetical protein
VVALPVTAPLTDLPPDADPCIALTPAVIDRLRTSGALTPLVPDEIPTSELIAAGRSLTGCPPATDPDPATVRAHVCPLLTIEGVDALAKHFRATPAVRADLEPERVAVARNALQCDDPAATAPAITTAGQGPAAVEASTAADDSNTVDRAGRGMRHEPSVVAIALVVTAAIAALIGVLLLLVVVRPRRRSTGGTGTSSRAQALHPPPGATGPERQQISHTGSSVEGQKRPTSDDQSDSHGRPENRSDSYDKLLEALRREVTELQRADEASRKNSHSVSPDDQSER